MLYDGMSTLTVDWETFYSREYSLSKMTTQEYVLSPFFEPIGVSVKLNGRKAKWFSGSVAEIGEWLKQFPWKESVVIAHNALFDGAILEWRFNIKPKAYFCTMMAARPTCVPFTENGRSSLKFVAEYLNLGVKGTEVQNALGMRRRDFSSAQLKKYGEYCTNDCDLSYGIYQKLVEYFPDDELRLIDATIQKYTRPQLALATDLLAGRLNEIIQEKGELLRKLGMDDRSELMSNPKFAEALNKLGVTPPTKISPATGKETYAFAKTDPEFKDLLEHPDLEVQTLVSARLAHKSTGEETRIRRLLAIGHANRMSGWDRIGIPLLYYGAHTGRLSGLDKLNMQNPKRGSVIRNALVAPPGHKVVVGDLSQIEARVLAAIAGEEQLLELYRAGADVYVDFAQKVYSGPIDKTRRFVGKTCILALGFLVGAEKLYNTLQLGGADVSFKEAKRFVYTYRNTYTRIPALWGRLSDILLKMMKPDCMETLGPNGQVTFLHECAVLPNGMKLHYPDMEILHGRLRYRYRNRYADIYNGKLCENIVQALARIILTTAEMRLYKRGYRAALSVHDELVYVVPEAKAEKFAVALEKALTCKVDWLPELPLAAEVAIGDSYGSAK